MIKGLASLLTPVYNGELYISVLLDSVLNQDYPCIECIIVNDGSSDKTLDIIDSYREKILRKGYSLQLLNQENQGLSSAINNGLKLVTGEYLIWPDSDDFFTYSNSISNYVRALKEYNVKVGRCLVNLADEKTKQVIQKSYWYGNTVANLFEDCLYGKNGFGFFAGSWIISTDALDKCIAGRNIYTDRTAGQNYQLLLPVLYNYDCVTIKQYLYTIVVRNKSLSHENVPNYDKIESRYISYHNSALSALEMLNNISNTDKKKYKDRVRYKYIYFLFKCAIKYGRYRDANKYRKILTEELKSHISLKDQILYFFCIFSPYLLLKKISSFFNNLYL